MRQSDWREATCTILKMFDLLLQTFLRAVFVLINKQLFVDVVVDVDDVDDVDDVQTVVDELPFVLINKRTYSLQHDS
ncbi:unnamed protein product [Clavelina lepadiformis]|uniref:Uncharacterized protein n=1 Tax=Clavelina lepadiformis TaxID=159417 RepID=A0ABP0FXS3_CLALP